MNKLYESSTKGIYIQNVKRSNIFLHWIGAGTYASNNADLPNITAQSVNDWGTQLEALIEMIDPMFWPSFHGSEYRKA